MRDKLLSLLKPQASPEVKLSVVALFLAKVLESFEPRIVDLEARQLQKGDKGEEGKNGIDGKNGKDGKNGLDGKNGKDGKDGKSGKDGKDGKQGISVVDAEVDLDDHLVLRLSDGKIIDCGKINLVKNVYLSQSIINEAQPVTDTFVQSDAFQDDAFQ